MEAIDDRRRRYMDWKILEIIILLQLFGLFYRSAKIFLTNNKKYLRITEINVILRSQTLPKKARLFDLQTINSEIYFLYSMEFIAAIDSFMVHTGKHSTALSKR